MDEVERTLLFVTEARKRAERAAVSLRTSGAEPHLVEAMDDLVRSLGELHRTAMQRTYFAVPKAQLSLG